MSLPITTKEAEYLKDDPAITHKVQMEITHSFVDIENNELIVNKIGDLTLGLFGITVPKTVKNFVSLANMTYGYGYRDNKFHRIIKDFMVQAGHTKTDKSIYGSSFEDENFTLKHDKLGRLSMANAGPNTNSEQFFITTRENCGWLDGHHVVFGQLIDGFETLQLLNEVDTADDKPIEDFVITKIEITTIYDSDVMVHSLENPVETVIETPTQKYSYFYIFTLFIVVVWVFRRVYYKRQYITDIKDSNYF